jgi:3-oxoacyl-[acyl-carrier protein] reductase
MDMQLNGKKALVTGSGSGIGAAIAKSLAAEGAIVVVHGRDQKKTEIIMREIQNIGGTAFRAHGDLTTDSGAQSIIGDTLKSVGAIDILVNNAGATLSAANHSWFDTDMDGWVSEYQINMLSSVRMIRAFADGMKKQGWGRIIQISSRNAISPYANFPAYGAAKAALNHMTLSLSKELSGTGITVNGIMPGLIYTPLLDPWFQETAIKSAGSSNPEDGRKYILKNIIKQTVDRLGMPSDIAHAVCYMASPLSDFMNGTTLRLDGGATPTI